MKRRMKKLTAMLLCAAMAVSMLGGCGKGKEDESGKAKKSDAKSGETEITFWCKDAISTGVQETAVADAIAEKTGVRLSLIHI